MDDFLKIHLSVRERQTDKERACAQERERERDEGKGGVARVPTEGAGT